MLNINTKSNISFGSIKAANNMASVVSTKSRDILYALDSINPDLKQLNECGYVYGAKKVIKSLKKLTNLDCITKDGVIFKSGEKKVRFEVPDRATLIIEESDNKNNIKNVQIKYDRLVQANGFSSTSAELEKFLTEIFDKFDFVFLQIRKFFARKDIAQILEKFMPRAVLKNSNEKIVNDIKMLFIEIQEKIASIKNPSSRTKIKNGYKTIKTGTHGSKQINFEKIGNSCEDYTVNRLVGRDGEEYLFIKIKEENNIPQCLFVRTNGEVLKELNFSRVLKVGDRKTYYTQRELDSVLLGMRLETLRDELIKYKQYIEERIKIHENIKKHSTTEDIGTLDTNSINLINTVKKLCETCKLRIKNIKEADRKKAFKQKYKIDTVMASPTLILRDITPANESILISFPVMEGKTCTKIIVLGQNDKIKKSIFIRDDKMLKFRATSLGRSKRKDTATNYHSQQEINDSGLNDYLLLLKARLESVPPARKRSIET